MVLFSSVTSRVDNSKLVTAFSFIATRKFLPVGAIHQVLHTLALNSRELGIREVMCYACMYNTTQLIV